MRNQLFQILRKYNFDPNNFIQTDGLNMEQLEIQIFEDIQYLRENVGTVYNEIYMNVKQSKKKIVNLTGIGLSAFQKFSQVLETQHSEIERSFSVLQCKSSLVDINYLDFLCKTVERKSNKSITSISKILAAKQKLETLNEIKEIMKGEQQLLLILRSETGNIFGAYTPCEWNINQGQEDDSLNSFLFSYTLGEIYPLKANSRAFTASLMICNDQDDSLQLTFGGSGQNDYDILLSDDLQSGFSRLGVAYEANEKNNSFNSSYLFGALQPKVTQFEIFKIQFDKK